MQNINYSGMCLQVLRINKLFRIKLHKGLSLNFRFSLAAYGAMIIYLYIFRKE